jgi:hypothetical protein
MKNHEQKKKVKKVKSQGSMGKTNFFLSTLSFSPWAISASWLHVGPTQNIGKTNLKLILNKTSP